MITAIDTNVLLDVFLPNPRFVVRSSDAMTGALTDGSIVASDIVIAEFAGFFKRSSDMWDALEELGVSYSPSLRDSAAEAGRAWAAYRRSGGRRGRVVADFLIGAHAQIQADRLLSRDRGFYRKYFSKLALLDPSA